MTLGNVFLEIFQKQSNQSKNKQMGLWQTKKASAKEVKFSQLCPTLCDLMDCSLPFPSPLTILGTSYKEESYNL